MGYFSEFNDFFWSIYLSFQKSSHLYFLPPLSSLLVVWSDFSRSVIEFVLVYPVPPHPNPFQVLVSSLSSLPIPQTQCCLGKHSSRAVLRSFLSRTLWLPSTFRIKAKLLWPCMIWTQPASHASVHSVQDSCQAALYISSTQSVVCRPAPVRKLCYMSVTISTDIKSKHFEMFTAISYSYPISVDSNSNNTGPCILHFFQLFQFIFIVIL